MENSEFDHLLKLTPDSSKAVIEASAKILIQETKLIGQMVEFTFAGKGVFSSRASRIIEHCDYLSPKLVQPHYPRILVEIPNSESSIKRSFLKMFNRHIHELKEADLSMLLEKCIAYCLDLEQEVAIRYYALEILLNIALEHHWFARELRELVKVLQIKEQTPSFNAKCRQVVLALNKHKLGE